MLLVTVSELHKQLRSNFAAWHLSALATICGRLHQFNDPPCPCVRSHTRSARRRGCLAVSQQAQEAKNLCTYVALIADVQSVCSHCLLGRLVMPDCHDAMEDAVRIKGPRRLLPLRASAACLRVKQPVHHIVSHFTQNGGTVFCLSVSLIRSHVLVINAVRLTV